MAIDKCATGIDKYRPLGNDKDLCSRSGFTKAKHRGLKLRSLKLPNLKTWLRLHRGGIQPVTLWGVERQGLAPRYRATLRQALAGHLGHQRGGNLDITYDIHARQYQDPTDQVLQQHIKVPHRTEQTKPKTRPETRPEKIGAEQSRADQTRQTDRHTGS